MPKEVLFHLAPVPFVAGVVLLATWPWRRRAWPAALALGAAYATGHVAINGLPEGLPTAAENWALPFALGAMLVGAAERPLWLRLALRLAFSAAVVWIFLRTTREPTLLLHAGLVAGLFAWWSALDWRAERVRGFLLPVALWMAASAAAGALLLAHSAKLSEMAAVLAAAMGAFAVLGAWNREQRAEAGVYAVALFGIMACGYFFADVFPAKSGFLLAAAPLLTTRRWWLTLVLVAVPVALALWFAYDANPATGYDY